MNTTDKLIDIIFKQSKEIERLKELNQELVHQQCFGVNAKLIADDLQTNGAIAKEPTQEEIEQIKKRLKAVEGKTK